jgi:hypothetical protein
MKKRKPKSVALSASRRREELEAVSGVDRKKPVTAAAGTEKGRAGRKGVVI